MADAAIRKRRELRRQKILANADERAKKIFGLNKSSQDDERPVMKHPTQEDTTVRRSAIVPEKSLMIQEYWRLHQHKEQTVQHPHQFSLII